MDNEDTERQHRDPDIAGEEKRTLARHHLAVRLGIDPRLADYLVTISKLSRSAIIAGDPYRKKP